MPDEIRQVAHYSTRIPHKAGEGARLLRKLADAGVDFFAVWGYAEGEGKATLELIPVDEARFLEGAKNAGLKPGKKQTAFYVAGEDRPGAVASLLEKLAGAKVNVGAMQAVGAGSGRFGAVVFVPQASVAKAANAFGVSA